MTCASSCCVSVRAVSVGVQRKGRAGGKGQRKYERGALHGAVPRPGMIDANALRSGVPRQAGLSTESRSAAAVQRSRGDADVDFERIGRRVRQGRWRRQGVGANQVAKQVATGVAGWTSIATGVPSLRTSATSVNGDLSAGELLRMQAFKASVVGSLSCAHNVC